MTLHDSCCCLTQVLSVVCLCFHSVWTHTAYSLSQCTVFWQGRGFGGWWLEHFPAVWETMSLYLLAGMWNEGRRVDENKQFSVVLCCFGILPHSAQCNLFTAYRVRRYFLSSFKLLSAQSFVEKRWLPESQEPFCTAECLWHWHHRLFLRKYSFLLLSPLWLRIFTRLLHSDPIRGAEESALNYMNANMFCRRPKERSSDLNDWSNVGLMIHFKSNFMSLVVLKITAFMHIFSTGFSVSRHFDTFRPQFITVSLL